jgi:hypothetical protein
MAASSLPFGAVVYHAHGTRENLQTQRLMAQLRGCGSRVYGKPQAFAGNIGTTGSTTSLAERFIASCSAASYEYSTGRGVAKPVACRYPSRVSAISEGFGHCRSQELDFAVERRD